MNITTQQVKSILTEQHGGFLSVGPHPFTHTLSPYTGCGFGNTACGMWCYSPSLPSWKFGPAETGFLWGEHVVVKENAAEVLEATLSKMSSEKRRSLRIFMSSATDPYQPIEAEYRITAKLLDVFSRYDDLGLLVVQTRSPLAERDFDIMDDIPYLWLSVTVETDDQKLLGQVKPGGPTIKSRLNMVDAAEELGMHSQIVVSPCLPYSKNFWQTLTHSGAERFVVDSYTAGDGARGNRTANSQFAVRARELSLNWRDEKPALDLLHTLQKEIGEDRVGFSASGFCSIPSYEAPIIQLQMFLD